MNPKGCNGLCKDRQRAGNRHGQYGGGDGPIPRAQLFREALLFEGSPPVQAMAMKKASKLVKERVRCRDGATEHPEAEQRERSLPYTILEEEAYAPPSPKLLWRHLRGREFQKVWG